MIAKNPTPMPPSTFFADLIEKNRDQAAEIDRLKAELAAAISALERIKGNDPGENRERADEIANEGLAAYRKAIEPNPLCACSACNPKAWWMVVCSICGNKRCPHAESHTYECTNSNEPNQPKTTLGPVVTFTSNGGNLAQ